MTAHGGAPVVLVGPGGGKVAVSPAWQGRVMTSAVDDAGPSLGFVHRAFIEAGKTGTAFDNYGGEDRFWLGPEGGQFGLYFAPGAPFAFDQWQTPHEMQEGAWTVASIDKNDGAPAAVHMTRTMHVVNHSKTAFDLAVKRSVRVLSADEAKKAFGTAIPAGAKWIAFESDNTVTNTGKAPWTKQTGLLSIWILGMYNPSPDTHVAIPYEKHATGPVLKDDYFGKVPADRLVVHGDEAAIVFSADGDFRSKIGVPPSRAKPVLGSYSRASHLFTVVAYDKPEGATDYVNSAWETQKAPFGGDVVNSYNDGAPAPGKPKLGGFYELETSSPAAALAPGQSVHHVHRTLHVVLDEAALEPFAVAVLGLKPALIAKPLH
jgi:hypothetical protein